MNKIFTFFRIAFLLLTSLQAQAGTDPIAWGANRIFPETAIVGRSYEVTYTFTNQLPFTLVRPLVINKNASPALEFSYDDQCSQLKLVPGQSCQVTVTFLPILPGIKQTELIISGYSNDNVVVGFQRIIVSGEAQAPVYGVVTQSLPATMDQGSTAPWLFSFTNQSNTTVSGIQVQSNQSETADYSNQCASAMLAVGETCTVSGYLSVAPDASGIQNVTASFSYNGGSPVNLSTATEVNTSSGVQCSLVPPNLLPPIMVPSTRTIQFLCSNHTGSAITIDQNLDANITGSASANFTADAVGVNNNCVPGSLPHNAACQLIGTLDLNAVAVGAYDLIATLKYNTGSTASAETSTEVVAALPTVRTIIFKNECGFDVWLSLNGSALKNSPHCTSDAQCPTGTRCYTGNNTCFWENYNPDGGATHQLTNGQEKNVTIPATTADAAVAWSGNFSASTGCSGSTCLQASCQNNGGQQSCAPGIGFSQPATQAEITMNKKQNDSYDIEVINGFHIPISMEPLYLVGPPEIAATPQDYTCGTPGQETAGNNFGACDWNTAVVPSNLYNWVTSGGEVCNVSSPSCSTGGKLCGLDTNLKQVCGDFLGFWTSNQICNSKSIPTEINTLAKCTQKLPAGYPAGSILHDLMKCSVPTGDLNPLYNSCYLSYPGFSQTQIAQCCGCIDWWTLDSIQSNPNTSSCKPVGKPNQSNPVWTENIRSGFAWMKKACPSAYVYPFDDKTSGFSCSNNLSNQPNSTSYRITFCPGGKTGLPTGITEGRT